jgi:hypothetical protein
MRRLGETTTCTCNPEGSKADLCRAAFTLAATQMVDGGSNTFDEIQAILTTALDATNCLKSARSIESRLYLVASAMVDDRRQPVGCTKPADESSPETPTEA